MMPVGNWYHISLVYKPSEGVKVFLNGKQTFQLSSRSHSPARDTGSGQLVIGYHKDKQPKDIANPTVGVRVDELMFFNRQLTPELAEELYDGYPAAPHQG